MQDDLMLRLAALPGVESIEPRRDGLWLGGPILDVTAMARWMAESEGRLNTMTGAALPDGETEVIYHYTVGASAINFKTRTHGGALPSITPLVPAANWIEREIHDLFKADFPGHPKLERLIRPPQLAEGFFR